MKACGHVFKYGDNVDTDVIIPARYLNATQGEELAKHCMEDIDKEFIHKVKKGDLIVANKNFGCGSSRNTLLWPSSALGSAVLSQKLLQGFFTAIPSISAFQSLSVRKQQNPLRPEMR